MIPRELQPLLPGSIGEILVAEGRINPEQALQVLDEQRSSGQRFGDAAVRLGFVQPADIRYALGAQFRYPFLDPDSDSKVSQEVIAAYDPFSPEVEAIRGVRAQIILRSLAIERREKAIAVVSPGNGDGRSFLAANLAVVFAQLGERTLLIDGDLRRPRQHQLFGLDNRDGFSSVLAGRASRGLAVQYVPGLNLAVLPSGPVPPNPQELLLGPALLPLLADVCRDFDMVLIDTPAADNADAHALGARVGAALLVVTRNRTRFEPARQLTQNLEDSGCIVLGAVMNSGA